MFFVFCMPHTTHITQPLDNGCFGPLKRFWKEECQQYCTKNPGRVITRLQFSQLFSCAWYRGMTMENIVSGLRHTGVYPFNRDALQPKPPQPTFDPASLTEKTGLQYTIKNGVLSEHQGVKCLCVTLTRGCSHNTPMSR